MKMTSVRLKLTLWNIGIMALVLTVFLLVVHTAVRTYLVSGTDSHLRASTERSLGIMTAFANGSEPPPPPPSPPPGEPPGFPRGHRERLIRLFDLNGKSITPFGRKTRRPVDPLDRSAFNKASKGERVFSIVKTEDSLLRVYSVPVSREGKRFAVLQTGASFAEVNAVIHRLTLTLVLLMPVALLAAGVGGLFLTSRALRPVRQIVDGANTLNTDDLSRRLPVVGADEFAHLAETINSLLSRLEQAFGELRNSIERERRLTADASHELRTPLTAIKAHTTLALRGVRTPEEYREVLSSIDLSADTMNRLIQDLLLLARSDSGQLSPRQEDVGVSTAFDEAVVVVTKEHPGPRIRTDIEKSARTVWADPGQLHRLLVNLLDNAMRHTPAEGEIVLSARSDDSSVLLSVTDTGEGMTPDQLQRLGERFYRADASRTRESGGTGLGIAICRSIVEAHGGTITVNSNPGQGTQVTVRLPARTC